MKTAYAAVALNPGCILVSSSHLSEKKRKEKKRIPMLQFLFIPTDSDFIFVRLKHQYCLKAPHAKAQPGLRITTLVKQLMTDKCL